MLRSSLRSLTPAPLPILAAAGVDPTARAETVPLAAFCAMARAWDAAEGRGGGAGAG